MKASMSFLGHPFGGRLTLGTTGFMGAVKAQWLVAWVVAWPMASRATVVAASNIPASTRGKRMARGNRLSMTRKVGEP